MLNQIVLRFILPFTMLDFAIEVAREAGELANSFFKTQLKVTYKADNSPVTQADRQTEQLIRKLISKKFPDHGIIGEEFKQANPSSSYQWVVDPIDGTREFVRHMPFWSTYVALLKNNKPVIGVIFIPQFNELFTAEKGKGAYLNGKKIKVSKTKNIERAYIVHGSINRFEKHGKLKGFLKLCKAVENRRCLGSYSFALLLKGNVDVEVEPGGGLYDFAAPSVLITEAGGKFTDFNGKFSLTSNNGVLSNGILHNQVLKLLNS